MINIIPIVLIFKNKLLKSAFIGGKIEKMFK
jgi:hypothetical protein